MSVGEQIIVPILVHCTALAQYFKLNCQRISIRRPQSMRGDVIKVELK